MNKEWKNKKMVVMQAGGLLSSRRSRMLRRAKDQDEPAPSDFNSNLTVTTNYFGNKVYVNNQLKYVLTEEGYIEKATGNNTYTAHYYLNDRLGNHRIVMDASGTVKQVNNYYPSGTSMAESPRRTDQGVQPYKFGGKELDRFNTLDHYDFEARAYDPVLMRFTRPDPLAEKYYSVSPYAYCNNNPVRYIDPDGRIPAHVVAGIVGGAIDYGLQVATNYVEGKSVTEAWTDVSVKSILISTGTSAVGVGLASKVNQVANYIKLGKTATQVVKVAGESVVNATLSAGTQLIENGEISLGQVAVNVGAGAIGGKLGREVKVSKQASSEGKTLTRQADRVQRLAAGNNPKTSRVEKAQKATAKAENYGNSQAAATSVATSSTLSKTIEEIKKENN